jgi:hypothetical protein
MNEETLLCDSTADIWHILDDVNDSFLEKTEHNIFIILVTSKNLIQTVMIW